MRFEVNLPGGMDCSALGMAGLDADAVVKLSTAVITDKTKLPATVQCPCTLTDAACTARVTIFSFGDHETIDRWIDKSGKIVFKRGKRPTSATRVAVEIEDEKIGRAIRKVLERYSFENDGEGVSWG